MSNPTTDAERVRENIIDEGIKARKFSASRADHYRRLYASDPEGTKRLIASLAPGLPGGTAAIQDDSYDRSWLSPEERNRPTAANVAATPAPAAPVSAPAATVAAGDDSYPTDWLLPEERARLAAPPERVVLEK